MTQFIDLGLNKPILKALAAEGYEKPTPIQAQSIPAVMAGRDLLGIAQTGTGKTAAFALPILHRLAENRKAAPRRGCRVLVLSPTRELATQIAESFRTYGANLGMTVAVVFGGAKYGPQIRALAAGVDVLVATPGRLIDHLGEKMCQLGETEILVLDEADQMLDLGFLQPIRRIVSHMPKQRQNLFFSATMPGEIGKLAGELLRDPHKVTVAPSGTAIEKVDQSLIFVEAQRKRALLAEMFADSKMSRAIVFTRTKRGADRVAKYLEAAGVNAAAIHGDKSQGQRERALGGFRDGRTRVLVATDIAARGIDVDGVSHVVNFELPFVPEAYVHRIGRTARAGADGTAISFVAGDEMKLLRDIEKVTRQKIPAIDRRNDKQLGQLDASIMASGVGKKATMPEREERDGRGGRGPGRNRNPRRDGVKLEGGGQPHRVRKAGPGRDARPTPERAFDPLARERPRQANNDPRHGGGGGGGNVAVAAKPDGEIKRRPRRRRPSNGGQGYAKA